MLETERVREADSRARGAYRSRDQLAALLSRIDSLHNDRDGDGICSCKLLMRRCAVWRALEQEPEFLARWEPVGRTCSGG
jgi:hypothetical protein